MEPRGSMTVNELIKELQELPKNIREAKLHDGNQEWINYVVPYTKEGRIQENTPSKDIRVMICNDVIFHSELRGVEHE